MQKLTIDHFGPIPHCCLNIKDFMVLIGGQATGKSTICKSIYYFKSIRDEVKTHLHDIINKGINPNKRFPSAVNSAIKYKFVNLFGMTKFKDPFYLRFDYDENIILEITITQDDKKYLNFIFSDNLIQKIRELEDQANYEYEALRSINSTNELYLQLERSKYFLSIDGMVNNLFNDARENFYIPAGRGLLSLLTNQLLNIEPKNMDFITSDFMKLIQRERNIFNATLFDTALISLIENYDLSIDKFKAKREYLANMVKDILKGEYYYKDDKEYIRLKNKSWIPINFASSGQQEILWILNLLFLWMLQNKKIFVVIEEPEAHLFPNAQKEIIDFIALFANSNENQVMITTHSPYILTASNNLLYAGKVGTINNSVDSIIKKEMWLKPSSFGAYMIGGTTNYTKSIIDDEFQEIESEEIDRISKVIRNDYAEIYNLEVNNEYTE